MWKYLVLPLILGSCLADVHSGAIRKAMDVDFKDPLPRELVNLESIHKQHTQKLGARHLQLMPLKPHLHGKKGGDRRLGDDKVTYVINIPFHNLLINKEGEDDPERLHGEKKLGGGRLLKTQLENQAMTTHHSFIILLHGIIRRADACTQTTNTITTKRSPLSESLTIDLSYSPAIMEG
jgi:hypothetical protein